MNRKYWVVITILMLFFVSSVIGSQIIRFKSGTVLVAQQYRVEGKLIYVILEKGNEVGFPMALVDKIEDRRGQTLRNVTLFNKTNSAASRNSKALSSGNNHFPPGFTSEIDSIARYRRNKSNKSRKENSGTFYTSYTALNAKDKLRSVIPRTSIGSLRGTTTTTTQGKSYNITVKTSRHSRKPSGGGVLQPKIPK